MIIKKFPSGVFHTNVYLLICEETSKAAVVDPSLGGAESVNAYLTQHRLKLEKILLTHSHWDHIGDVANLKATHNPSIYIHPFDIANLEIPGSDGLPLFEPIKGIKADHLLGDKQEIHLGDILLHVIHTPGHTRGSVCFYIPKSCTLLSGDTLFKGSMGNISFPTSEPELIWNSLDKLRNLPLETQVLPGHGESTSIKEETWLSDLEDINR